MRAAVMLVVLITLVRFIGLMRTPAFGDEGLYCYLGYQINQLPVKESSNLVLNMWKDAPLLPVVNAVALKLFPIAAPLWTCRVAVTVTAGLGAMIVFSLGGWWAGLFYLLNPFSFFLDRTVLMEPILNVAMLGYIWLSVKAIETGRIKQILAAGGAAVVMLMAKQTGILALPIPLVMAWAQRKKLTGVKNWIITTAVVVVGVVGMALQLTKLADTAAIHTTTVMSLVRIKTNLWLMGNWLIQYWSWGVVPVMVVGIWQAVKRKRWDLIIIPIMLVGIFAGVGLTLFPRYLLTVVPFGALVARQAAKSLAGKVLLIVLLVTFVRRDITILIHPDRAQLARETRYQFWEDWGSGVGTKAALEWLSKQNFNPGTVLLVPQDIQGVWVMSQLSWAQDFNVETKFYTNDDSLIDQVRANKNGQMLVVATANHWQLVNSVKQEYELRRLLATHGENRNSITIDEVKK